MVRSEEPELDLPPICLKALDDASAAMDGEASEAEVWNARRHLRGCPSCRDMEAGMRGVRDRLRAAANHPERMSDRASTRLRWHVQRLVRSNDPSFAEPPRPTGPLRLRLVKAKPASSRT